MQWANALTSVAAEHLAGIDCDAAAEARHRSEIATREKYKGSDKESKALLHQSIESRVQWDVQYTARVSDWKGIGWTTADQN